MIKDEVLPVFCRALRVCERARSLSLVFVKLPVSQVIDDCLRFLPGLGQLAFTQVQGLSSSLQGALQLHAGLPLSGGGEHREKRQGNG